MLIDLTLRVSPLAQRNAWSNEPTASIGHLGTHFDVMNKEFPLSFTRRNAVVFDAREAEDEVGAGNIDLGMVSSGMFIAFYTGYIEKHEYGSKIYFSSHPQLSDALIEELLRRRVSIIGIDCAGIRRGREHTPKDQHCADRGVFIVENLCSLGLVLNSNRSAIFTAHTYPMNFEGMTGLPCRVVAEIE